MYYVILIACITLKQSVDKRLTTYITNDTYLIAAILDPNIKQRWCSNHGEMEEKLLSHARKYEESCHSNEHDDAMSPPEKHAKTGGNGLLSFMTPKTKRIRNKSGDCVKLEIALT